MADGRPDLSVCLIVRDEEEHLPRCLRSVAEIADELVVVDTGSRDGTPAIARSFGARVSRFPWTGSFGAARNAALARATGRWILFLDADEEIHPDDRPAIGTLLVETDYEGFFLQVINFFGPEPGLDAATDLRLSLFRNRPGYHFRRPIHEEISETIRAVSPRARFGLAPVRLLHYGYLDGLLARKGKGRRNEEILLRAVASDPRDPFLHYCLAAELMEQGDYARAKTELLIAKEAWDAGHPQSPDVLKKLVVCERESGDLEAALTLVTEGLERYPDFTDLMFLRASLRLQLGQIGEAKADFRRCLELGEAPPRYASWRGVGTFRAQAALAALGLSARD